MSAQQITNIRKELNGKVFEADQGIPDVHIINLSSGDAVISNEAGYFVIDAREADTLLFSAVQYKRKTLIIRPEHTGSVLLEIPMEPFVNMLDEVVLRPYNLTGDLNRDLTNVPVEEAVNPANLGLPNAYVKEKTQTERKLYEATTGSGLIPLNPILNAISGRTKMLKKRLARDKAVEKAEKTWSLYSDTLLLTELDIREAKLTDFKYFCEADPLFDTLTDAGDYLKLWGFIRRKAKDYNAYNASE